MTNSQTIEMTIKEVFGENTKYHNNDFTDDGNRFISRQILYKGFKLTVDYTALKTHGFLFGTNLTDIINQVSSYKNNDKANYSSFYDKYKAHEIEIGRDLFWGNWIKGVNKKNHYTKALTAYKMFIDALGLEGKYAND